MNRRYLIIVITAVVGVVLLGILVFWLRNRDIAGSVDLPSSTERVATSTAPEDLGPPPVDTDKDGLSDDAETAMGTDPTKQDTDGDGFTDYFEVVSGQTDPLSSEDAPADRVRSQERFEELFPSASTSAPPEPAPVQVDADGDGLTNQDEAKIGTDPNNPDSDGDGLSDGQEVGVYQTNPLSADTDGDGFQDADEINNGYNPRGPGRCEKPDCSA